MLKTWLLILILPILILELQAQEAVPPYSFFTAGHTYGVPNQPHYGLYEPFMNMLDYINDYNGMAMGCLTGDVVIQPLAEFWDAAQEDMDSFNMPLFIAAGNHDIGQEFVTRFGDYYYSFTYNGDLFITLVPFLGNWSITGDQKVFLNDVIDNFAAGSNHIFVFLHELIWWSPDNIFQQIILNNVSGYPGSTNFWTEIEPLFSQLSNQVVFFAGDLGCSLDATPYMYYSYGNITMVASGMGGGKKDNFIIVDVYPDSLRYHLIALNGDDINALGELTDFSLDVVSRSGRSDEWINCFPNPFTDRFYIDNNLHEDALLLLVDMNGKVILKDRIRKREGKYLIVDNLDSGFYILKVINQSKIYINRMVRL